MRFRGTRYIGSDGTQTRMSMLLPDADLTFDAGDLSDLVFTHLLTDD
jgi:hypothetical protein